MNATLLNAILVVTGTVIVAYIANVVAPRVTGKTTITTTDRDRLERNWQRTDDERIKEITSLKWENNELREAHDELERRYNATEQSVAALTVRVGQQDATITKQNGSLLEKETEIGTLKRQVLELRDELLEAYRRIDQLQRAQQGTG